MQGAQLRTYQYIRTYQSNGYMEDFLSHTWFEDVFLKIYEDASPQLVILDHGSHGISTLLTKAIEKNNTLAFPARCNH